MLNLSFYNLSALLMILVLLRFSLSQSGLNRFLTIFLGCILTFSIFDNSFIFLPLLFCLFTGKGSMVQAGKGPRNQLDTPSGPSSSGQWSFSPAEHNSHYCIEKTRYWANLGGCTAALVGISEIVLGILRRLDCTQVWVKKLTDKGFPRWLFFFITSSNPKQLSEKRLLHAMVSILIINFLILFMLFTLF